MDEPESDEGKLGRRMFVVASAAAATGCAATSSTGAASTTTPDPSSGPDLVACAEQLFGVRYTSAERALIAPTLTEQLALVMPRREVELPNTLGPAMIFDPVLPGTTLPAGDVFRTRTREALPLPGDDESIAYAPLHALSSWIARRELSSVRLTEIYLRRLRELGPRLECVITLTDELAMEQARRADAEIAAGELRGPLHGIPWGAKDLFDTAGIRTTWGATPFRDRVPDTDATVVTRLHEAGAVLVAKLTLGALAYGDRWFGGRTRNPWFLAEGSSGSSAGSAAAVAAGLVGFALGTETWGSIMSPSTRCGAVGLRPTFGRVPSTGAMSLCWSLDKAGPITRSADDAITVLRAIAGPDGRDPAATRSVPLAYDGEASLECRVGFEPRWLQGEALEPSERAAVEALRGIEGVTLVPIEIPELPYSSLTIELLAEAAAAFEALTLSNRDDELVWQAPEAWPNALRAARFLSAVDVLQAQRLRRRVMEALARVFDDHRLDAIVGPTLRGPLAQATCWTGHPAFTLPTGFLEVRAPRGVEESSTQSSAPRRVPHSVTLWGRLFDEGTLCRLGAALESALDLGPLRPPLT